MFALFALALSVAGSSALEDARFLGISLSDDADIIARALKTADGFTEAGEKTYRDGAVERRYKLTNAFIRITYPSSSSEAKPKAIEASVESALAPAVDELAKTLGKPTWKSKVRRVWGGKGAPEAGLVPAKNAKAVVDISRGPDNGRNVTLATPAWYQGN
jgi:hypothetical protein